MAHISGALFHLLANDGTLSALIAGRVRRVLIDEKEQTPFVQLILLSLAPTDLLGSNRRPIHKALVEVSSWADDYDLARELAEAVREVIDQTHNATVQEVDILHVLQIDEEEQGIALAPDVEKVRIVQTYEVEYRS